jgi:hypothetical protein
MTVRDTLLIASELISKLGCDATNTLEAIVDQQMEAGDMEDVIFWREIAKAVRTLQRPTQQGAAQHGGYALTENNQSSAVQRKS